MWWLALCAISMCIIERDISCSLSGLICPLSVSGQLLISLHSRSVWNCVGIRYRWAEPWYPRSSSSYTPGLSVFLTRLRQLTRSLDSGSEMINHSLRCNDKRSLQRSGDHITARVRQEASKGTRSLTPTLRLRPFCPSKLIAVYKTVAEMGQERSDSHRQTLAGTKWKTNVTTQ